MSSAKTLEKKKAVKNSVGRLIFVGIAILLEIFLITSLIFMLNEKYAWLAGFIRVLAMALVIGIFSQDRSASLKMPWIVLILLVPIIGVTLYLMVGMSGSTRRMRKRYAELDDKLFPLLQDDSKVLEKIEKDDKSMANVFRYTSERAHFPVYDDTDVTYFPEAKIGLETQKRYLRLAKEFIFMEYHAIEDEEAFEEVKEILAKKAREGVEVRVFYDELGSIGFINKDFIKRMEALGIRCRVFNPVIPFANVFLNHRDHRKITVIDGRVGFTGGYNLANEYFDITRPYGQWKDTGIMLKGSGVRSLTMMFLEMWNAVSGNDINDVYYDRYMPEFPNARHMRNYIQPYGDTPLDDEHTGENVYMNIINSATDYVWFVTPYLIISDEMNRALTLAAARGVDVRIITPGVPDKKTIYVMTRSYYSRLAKDGVKIYEYVPGFCHAKMCISDDRIATCGTINMDYRSLYHHFENGCIMYKSKAVDHIKEDFDQLLERCLEVTDRYSNGQKRTMRIAHHILRMFSPLL